MADLYEEVSRGTQAQDFLDHPLTQEFFSKIRENLHKEIEFSKASDTEGREQAWRMLKVVNEFDRHIRSIIETGQLAQKQISLGERVTNLFGGRF